jgi:elongation factor P hydroxylase
MKNRRDFLKVAGSSLVLGSTMHSSAIATIADAESSDETDFIKWYDVDRSITNLENAYWNVMAKPVAAEYFRKLTYVNRRNVPFVRGVIPDESLPVELESVRASVA